MKTAIDMLDRLEALARSVADAYGSTAQGIEARAIVAELPPPVDPDLMEAREICARNVIVHNDSMKPGYLAGAFDHHWLMKCVVEGIKLGRALEHAGK